MHNFYFENKTNFHKRIVKQFGNGLLTEALEFKSKMCKQVDRTITTELCCDQSDEEIVTSGSGGFSPSVSVG